MISDREGQSMEYFFILIGILVVVNFYLLFKRTKRSRFTKKNAQAERMANIKRRDDLIRKLDLEQKDAARRVELRNKTFEMYEQVRQNAAAAEAAKEK